MEDEKQVCPAIAKAGDAMVNCAKRLVSLGPLAAMAEDDVADYDGATEEAEKVDVFLGRPALVVEVMDSCGVAEAVAAVEHYVCPVGRQGAAKVAGVMANYDDEKVYAYPEHLDAFHYLTWMVAVDALEDCDDDTVRVGVGLVSLVVRWGVQQAYDDAYCREFAVELGAAQRVVVAAVEVVKTNAYCAVVVVVAVVVGTCAHYVAAKEHGLDVVEEVNYEHHAVVQLTNGDCVVVVQRNVQHVVVGQKNVLYVVVGQKNVLHVVVGLKNGLHVVAAAVGQMNVLHVVVVGLMNGLHVVVVVEEVEVDELYAVGVVEPYVLDVVAVVAHALNVVGAVEVVHELHVVEVVEAARELHVVVEVAGWCVLHVAGE